MDAQRQLEALLADIIGQGSDADKFTRAFGAWCHAIDDVVDVGATPETIVKNFALGAAVFTSNFYRAHADQLYPVVVLIANAYADSVAWEKSGEDWKRRQADVLRNCGNDMLLAVVLICGGYDAMRQVSQLIRETSHFRHHDEQGNPI